MFALLLVGCSKDPAPGPSDAAVRECSTRAECEAKGTEFAGMVCSVEGACLGCQSNGECALRERCDGDQRRCVFKDGWGTQCALNADCQAGQLCVQGLCKSEKDVVLCSAWTCLAEGQRCNRANGVCEEDIGCNADSDCTADLELCNLPTNTCVLRCTSDTQAQVCTAGQKCLESRCTDCEDSSDCPGGMVCDRGRLACVVDGAARCLSDRDCAAGLECNPATGFCTPPPPPCLSNDDCLSGQRCDVAAGKCVPRACQPDRFEPNPAMSQAHEIASGDYPSLTLCDGEQDWFSVRLTRGDRFNVFVDADPLFQDVMDTRLLDAQGQALAEGALALDKTVSEDTTYYLRLRADDAFVEYGLRVGISRGTPCDEDRFHPNGNAASAASLHEQGEYDKLTLCGLEQDWFRLDVPAGKGVRVELHYVPTEGAADLLIHDVVTGTQLGKSDVTAPVQPVEIAAEAISGGQVFVVVASLDDRANAEYYLRVVYQ
ncbi:MAG: hypothetical protein HY901_08825 [Deltaproteobacteria bacterium]|nr:hypothetical protein [Deltaproteobacteria bacterium]